MANTTSSQLADSQITLMDQAFAVEASDKIVIDQFVTYNKQIGAKAIDFVKYSKLAYQTTALTDGTDPDAVAMSDSKVTLMPAEYGAVITTTSLANLQSGGKADLGASQVVARSMVESSNRLGLMAGQAGTNLKNGSSAVMTEAILNEMYYNLNKANAEKFGGDSYVAVVHPAIADVVSSLSGWSDVQKYADAMQVLKNEVGFFKGFRFISSSGMPFTGTGTTAVHKSIFMGRNALGKAESKPASLRITGPYDKLGRMVNVGWYGVFQYAIVDQDAIQVASSKATLGA
tara:strand:- start:3613 stop:4476 length:864 start_codon:yes stop_codon:yes gene_type:complete